MRIFDIIIPGSGLKERSSFDQDTVNALVHGLRSTYCQAHCALIGFSEEFENQCSEISERLLKAEDGFERWGVVPSFEASAIEALGVERFFKIPWEARVELAFNHAVSANRLRWEAGEIPESLKLRAGLYARAFIFSLDTFERMLLKLKNIPGVSSDIEDLHGQLIKSFGSVSV